jgi:hypothetical protein
MIGCVNPRGARVRKHLYIVPSFALVLLVFCWLITQGDWRFFEQEGLSRYYDAVAQSLLQGRLDVPRVDIEPEAFIHDGKAYGYFGMAPALGRIPLILALPAMQGEWSRLSMTLCCLLDLVFVYRLALLVTGPEPDAPMTRWQKWLVSLFVIAAGLGSTLIYLASRAFVNHEAIIWSSTLAIASAYYVVRYLADGRWMTLLFAGVAASLAFFSRPIAGSGALLAIVLVALQPLLNRRKPEVRHRQRHFILAVAIVAFTVTGYFGINYLKFGTIEGVPLQFYTQYLNHPERIQAAGGKAFHLANLRTQFMAYFGRPGIEFHREFPWVYMVPHLRVYPGAWIDQDEAASSIPGSMPALFALAVAGMVALIVGKTPMEKRLRLPAVALSAVAGLSLTCSWFSERYLHDLYPALILCATAGLAWLIRQPKPRAAIIVLAALTAISCLTNLAFALDYQREIVWGVSSDKQEEFQHWRQQLDAWLPQRSSVDAAK